MTAAHYEHGGAMLRLDGVDFFVDTADVDEYQLGQMLCGMALELGLRRGLDSPAWEEPWLALGCCAQVPSKRRP